MNDESTLHPEGSHQKPRAEVVIDLEVQRARLAPAAKTAKPFLTLTQEPAPSPSRLHVITGLPRSGSTLLATLLRQRPDTIASMSSPLWGILTGVVDAMGPANEFAHFLTPGQHIGVVRGALAGYMDDPAWAGRTLCVDTHRMWAATPELLFAIDPDARMLVTVRDVAQVVNSVERLIQRHPARASGLVGGSIRNSVAARIALLTSPDGMVGSSLAATRSLLSGPHADRVLVVRYGSLIQNTQAVMDAVAHHFGLSPWQHDLEHLPPADPAYAAFDAVRVNTPGLHHVPAVLHRDSVEAPFLLPEAAVAELRQMNFWEAPGATRAAMI